MVMPIRSGGGSRVKAVEAIAAGVPIISTAFGVKGLGLTPGSSYIAAEDAGSFATAIKTVATKTGPADDGWSSASYEESRARNSKEALRRAITASLADLGLIDPS